MEYKIVDKKYALAFASLLLLSNGSAGAQPLSGKIGVATLFPFNISLEGEVTLPETPYSFAMTGAYFPGAFMNPGQIYYSLYGRYSLKTSEHFSWGPIIGARQDWGRNSFREGFSANPAGGIVGVSLQFDAGRLWARVTPNTTLQIAGNGGLSTAQDWLGVPWIETGLRLSPNLELSLRASALPLRVTALF
ncbi:MAG TPA: hypothetical protein V6D00_06245 [Pantanalinema sp.]